MPRWHWRQRDRQSRPGPSAAGASLGSWPCKPPSPTPTRLSSRQRSIRTSPPATGRLLATLWPSLVSSSNESAAETWSAASTSPPNTPRHRSSALAKSFLSSTAPSNLFVPSNTNVRSPVEQSPCSPLAISSGVASNCAASCACSPTTSAASPKSAIVPDVRFSASAASARAP